MKLLYIYCQVCRKAFDPGIGLREGDTCPSCRNNSLLERFDPHANEDSETGDGRSESELGSETGRDGEIDQSVLSSGHDSGGMEEVGKEMEEDSPEQERERRYLQEKNKIFYSIEVNSEEIEKAIRDLTRICLRISRLKGFWDEERNFGEAIALIHSELSEALEGHRKGLADDHLPHRSSPSVELADTIIRVCDTAAGFDYDDFDDLPEIIFEKLLFNLNRPYKHGKKY